jgi:hypothetical protein
VPFDAVLANVNAFFDAPSHTFVAPQNGAYRFEYTVMLQAAVASQVQILAQIGDLISTTPVPYFASTTPVPYFASTTALSSETDTLTGSFIIDLLQGQTFRLTAANVGGACAIIGAQSAAPPYPSLLYVYSLF